MTGFAGFAYKHCTRITYTRRTSIACIRNILPLIQKLNDFLCRSKFILRAAGNQRLAYFKVR